MLDREAPLTALQSGRLDEDQRHALLHALESMRDTKHLNNALDAIDLPDVHYFTKEAGRRYLYPAFIEELSNTPSDMRKLLDHLCSDAFEFQKSAAFKHLRASVNRPPKDETTASLSPLHIRWEDSARVAFASSEHAHWVDMDDYEPQFKIIAQQLQDQSDVRGMPPSVALVMGSYDDDYDAFVSRLRDQFAAYLGTPQSVGQTRVNIGTQRVIAKLTFNGGDAMQDEGKRLCSLRYRFLKAIDKGSSPAVPETSATLIAEFERILSRSLAADVVVMRVSQDGFDKKSAALLVAWLQDCEQLRANARAPSPFQHIIYFENTESSPEEPAPGFLSTLFGGGRGPFVKAQKKFFAEPAFYNLSTRIKLTWDHIDGWTQKTPVLKGLGAFSDVELQSFKTHAKKVFDTQAQIPVRTFTTKLETFPSEPPKADTS